MVTERVDGGKALILALREAGFEVHAAFWAKPSDDGEWFLYLSSPVVDREGLLQACRVAHAVIRQHPDFWIDPFEVRLIGEKDPMAEAALEVVRPKPGQGPFAVPAPKPYTGMTRFGGGMLAGVNMDGVLIYPLTLVAAA
jgi:hypothetical protein